MRGLKSILAAICGFGMTAAAHAADMPGGLPFPDFKKQVYTDLVSGWYFRTDLGYRMNSIGAVDSPTLGPVSSWTYQNTPTLGIGGGYKYKWFRADATLDYGMRSKFEGTVGGVSAFHTTKIDSVTLLANVYLDLGEWGGFTPYVGAGVGTSMLRTHEYTNSTLTTADVVQDTSRWNLSWAAMGGVSYRITPGMLFDVSYRYLKLGDVTSGAISPSTTPAVYFRDLSAQEVRFGIRWILD